MTRDEVIKGLECCEKKICIFKDGDECPYWELCGEYENAFEDCTTALVKDVLALLKAQEPRVLSIADIIDNHVAPDVIWVELRDDTTVVGGIWDDPFYEMMDDSVMNDLGEEIARHPEAYGTKWRVWTSRPTDAQREATPWN